MPTKASITVKGEVQRAGYRYQVQDIARRIGITGLVRNQPDGTVQIIAEGEEDKIKDFIRKIKIKEPPIKVEQIETQYTKPTGEYAAFIIQYGEPPEEIGEGSGTGSKYLNLLRTETKEGFHNLGVKIDSNFKIIDQRYGGVSKELKSIRQEMGRLNNTLLKLIKTTRPPSSL